MLPVNPSEIIMNVNGKTMRLPPDYRPADILIGTNIGAGQGGRALRTAWITLMLLALAAEAVGGGRGKFRGVISKKDFFNSIGAKRSIALRWHEMPNSSGEWHTVSCTRTPFRLSEGHQRRNSSPRTVARGGHFK
ncbi:hypothetical protein BSZ19_35550 [Bradyrhizobium japonicum]|uniref:Uncharacterized protein n=1 Tax=Bradyrhizobium japonicum TaxID=375 RepID=A0A1Y2JH05_BRAJP|nr:hypothetical protein [Bradyrhizobium japonicum]OSJ26583.1 hypothetical protein BSZ19_35550 [Bradyrhizobium japonicum]